jgi:hypothetical protein
MTPFQKKYKNLAKQTAGAMPEFGKKSRKTIRN